jgi:hypothetical protein
VRDLIITENITLDGVMGRGQRLFADATELPRLRLVETLPFRCDVVLLRYRPT